MWEERQVKFPLILQMALCEEVEDCSRLIGKAGIKLVPTTKAGNMTLVWECEVVAFKGEQRCCGG